MNANQIANAIYDTVEMIVNKKVAEAGFDKTIQAQIRECIDATIGKYEVQYQDSVFTAFALNEIKYEIGQWVYILIPNNDWEQDKKILNAINKTGFSTTKQDQYQKVGANCFTFNKEDDNSLILYEKDNPALNSTLDINKVNKYIKNQNYLLCSSVFQTKGNSNNGNYGIKITVVDTNGITETCLFDINDMQGTPYTQNGNIKQEKIFYIDDFNYIEKIEFFKENIEVELIDLELFGAIKVGKNYTNERQVLISSSQGFVFDDRINNIILNANVYFNGELADNNSQKFAYYWFRENLLVDTNHIDYLPYGGKGWQCINQYTEINATKKNWITNLPYVKLLKKDYIAKDTKIKCVVVYEEAKISAETIITNKNEYRYDIKISSNLGENFDFNIAETIRLVCNVLVNQSNTNGPFSFKWTREDRNGTAIELSSITNIQDIDLKSFKEKATFKCGVFTLDGENIGTGSITITNTPAENASYDLQIINGNQVFKYNADGVSPTSSINQVPQVILPLKFILYDPQGNPIDIDKITSIKWEFPLENTLLKRWNYDTIKKQGTFEIATVYNPLYINNTITLKVTYNNQVFIKTTNFLFLKDGESGTNGTDFVCRIVPAYDIIPNEYPMIIKLDNILKMNYNNNENAPPTFKVQLYEGSKEITNISGSITWSIWSNTETPLYTITVSDNNCILALNGTFNTSKAAVLKVKVVHNNKIYYGAFPLITCNGSETLKLKYGTGYQEVLYNSAGKDPVCKGVATFEVEGGEGIWGVSTGQLIKEESSGNSATIIPIDEIDGLTMNNNIYYTVGTATLLIPVHMILNRFGLVNINEWDGSSIKISDNEYILSPQVGAGIKDTVTNKFTGLLMGKVKNRKSIEVGLFGYSNGLRSIFLDAKTGKATFGTATTGQIIINPAAADGLIIQSSNYKEEVNTGSGMKINLSTSSIKWGNGKFEVTNAGILHATGADIEGIVTADYGEIGGWTVDPYSIHFNGIVGLCSYDSKGEADSIYVKPSLKDGSPSDVRFFAGASDITDVANSGFAVLADGSLYANYAKIDGNSQIGIFKIVNGRLVCDYGEAPSSSLWTQAAIKLSMKPTNLSNTTIASLLTPAGLGVQKMTNMRTVGLTQIEAGFIRFMGYNGKMNPVADISINGNDFSIGSNNTTSEMKINGYLLGTWYCNSAQINASDRNVKHDIQDVPDAYEILFNNLQSKIFKYNDGSSDRYHTGFEAQGVDEALQKSGLTRKDFAAICILNEGTEKEKWGLRYDEFISLNTWQIQKLKAQVALLEKQIKILNKEVNTNEANTNQQRIQLS